MPNAHTYLSAFGNLSMPARGFRPGRDTRRGRTAARLVEALEPRTLMSATLFVTPSTTPVDATHFQTLQSALSLASDGDTIVLQAGFSAGNFNTTIENGSSLAGDVFIRTLGSVDVSEIISIGDGSVGDPIERDLVTSVTPTLLGDFIVSLASPLQFAHASSPVNANNPTSTGPTIGINKAVTLTTDGDADMTLPFNLEVWGGTTGVTISPHIFTPANSGPVEPPPPPPPPTTETISVTTNDLTVTQGGTLFGAWATFTDSAAHKARDFTVTVTFADGTVAKGHVFKAWGSTGFSVFARHKFTVADSESFTVSVSTTAATATADGSVTVNPRVLTAQGVDSSTDKTSLHNATVATFTDNLPSFCQHYTATITWSDGVTTTGQISWGWDGTFSVKTSRDLPGPGTLTGTVTIATDDGLASTTADFTLTVTAPAPTSGGGRNSGGSNCHR